MLNQLSSLGNEFLDGVSLVLGNNTTSIVVDDSTSLGVEDHESGDSGHTELLFQGSDAVVTVGNSQPRHGGEVGLHIVFGLVGGEEHDFEFSSGILGLSVSFSENGSESSARGAPVSGEVEGNDLGVSRDSTNVRNLTVVRENRGRSVSEELHV